MSSHLAIRSAQGSEDLVRTGLELLFADETPEVRRQTVSAAMSEIAATRSSTQGLFVAMQKNAVVGAVWCNVLPGRTASIWPPQVSCENPDQRIAVEQELLRHADQHLRQKNVQLVQSLVEDVDAAGSKKLLANGFRHLADLTYMVAMLRHDGARLPATAATSLPGYLRPLAFETFDPAQPARLACVIERTYTHTLDCPQLNGVRDIGDVIEGYKNLGCHDPSLWYYVRHDDRDVGCLLLTRHPNAAGDAEQADLHRETSKAATDSWELVYMGVSPEYRGRGWGTKIAKFARIVAARAGCSRIVLAVDSDNQPARKMYADANFVDWARRSVLVKTFD